MPWLELTRVQDRDAREVAARLREAPAAARPEPAPGAPIDPKAYMRDLVRHGLIPALRGDAAVLRAFLRSLNLLDPPGDLLRNPLVLERVLAAYQQRHEREEPALGPDRAGMLQVLERAA